MDSPPAELSPLPPLDRAAHLRKDIDFLEAELRAQGSLVLPVWRELALLRQGRVLLLPCAQASDLLAHAGELVWLGRLGARSCFALDITALEEPLQHPELPRGAELCDLRLACATLSAEDALLAFYGRGLILWHRRQRHCGVCGAQTAPRQGGHVRVCRDPACATEHFPRSDPAIIVLVSDGERALLGRQASWPKGMYSTLAGFVEPGETIEEAVVREVAEESGVRIRDVRYFRSQPWPFPSSLMLGFTARATSTEITLGADELEDARWFSRAQLRDTAAHGFFVPSRFTLSAQLIADFLARG